MKTYSVTIQVPAGYWVTNWHQYPSLDEIRWDEVEKHCLDTGSLAYGYQFGRNSRDLKSPRTRTVLKTLEVS